MQYQIPFLQSSDDGSEQNWAVLRLNNGTIMFGRNRTQVIIGGLSGDFKFGVEVIQKIRKLPFLFQEHSMEVFLSEDGILYLRID